MQFTLLYAWLHIYLIIYSYSIQDYADFDVCHVLYKSTLRTQARIVIKLYFENDLVPGARGLLSWSKFLLMWSGLNKNRDLFCWISFYTCLASIWIQETFLLLLIIDLLMLLSLTVMCEFMAFAPVDLLQVNPAYLRNLRWKMIDIWYLGRPDIYLHPT